MERPQIKSEDKVFQTSHGGGRGPSGLYPRIFTSLPNKGYERAGNVTYVFLFVKNYF